MWSGEEALDEKPPDQYLVLIKSGALGFGQPMYDLVMSSQHRILLNTGVLVPAKALTLIPRVRHMSGKRTITWYHFACRQHCVVKANGPWAESLLLGPMILDTAHKAYA